MSEQSSRELSIREAAYEAFKMAGIDVLKQPERFLGIMLDLVDPDSALMRLLAANCDAEYLAPFVRAAEEETSHAIGIASRQASIILRDGRLVQGDAANNVSAQMAFAVAAYCGIQPPEEVLQQATEDARASLMARNAVSEAEAAAPPAPLVPEVTTSVEDADAKATIEPTAPVDAEPMPQAVESTLVAEPVAPVAEPTTPVAEPAAPVAEPVAPVGAAKEKKLPIPIIAGVVGIVAVVGIVLALMSGGSSSPSDSGSTSMTSSTSKEAADDVDYASLADELKPAETVWENVGGKYVYILRVKNTTQHAFDITGTFQFSDGAGTEDEASDSAWHVAPGETAFLEYDHDASEGGALVGYELVTAAPTGTKSLKEGKVSAEVIRASDEEGMVIEVNNEGTGVAKVLYATLYGENEKGNVMKHTQEVGSTLQPGESVEVEFSDYLPDTLTNNELYLFGYVE